MKTLKKLITYLPVIYLAWLLSSCGGGVEGIDIKMNIPITVNTNEEFVTQITVTNTLNNSQTLLSIDIGDNYLEGIALLKTEPNFTEQMHIPIDNSVSYSFGEEIGPQETITIDLYWKALSEGEFSDEIDFCINSDFSFISKGARTKVGGESSNTTTGITTETVVETTTATNPSKETNTSSSEGIKISAKQLVDELESNEIRFMNNYKGKLLEVTGKIAGFDTGFLEDELVVNLDGGGGDWSITSVDCNLEKDQNEIVGNYNKGNKITIQGKCDGEIMGSPLLKHCIIVK